MSRRNRALPPPHLKPDGDSCDNGSYFPTKEAWHGHYGRDECPKCKADVSESHIPKNRGGGGIEIDVLWPSNNSHLPLYLWDELDDDLELNYHSILLKVLEMKFDNDDVKNSIDIVVLVYASNYEKGWAEENYEKLNEQIFQWTGKNFVVDYVDATAIFTDPSNTWITNPEN